MKQTKSQRNDRKPLIVQTFPSSDVDDVFQNIFRTAVVCRGLRYVRQANFQSERAFMASMADDYIRPDDEVLAEMRDECDLRLALRRGAILIQLFACLKYRRVSLFVAGPDAPGVAAALAAHTALFQPPAQPAQIGCPGATFGFWFLSDKGPEREEKSLTVPSWQQSRENYAASTAHAIDTLAASFKPAAGGRLLLWHGMPGTGKTFAIRALAWEWRKWCQFEYIFDPENLFGSRADYLARIVMDGNEQAEPDCG